MMVLIDRDGKQCAIAVAGTFGASLALLDWCSASSGRPPGVFVLFGFHRRKGRFLSFQAPEIGNPGADVDPVNSKAPWRLQGPASYEGTMPPYFGSLF